MKNILKKLRIFMIAAVAVVLIGFGVLGQFSQNKENISTFDAEKMTLAVCPDSPNCVSSFDAPDNSHYMEPVNITPERFVKVHSFFAQEDCTLQKKDTYYKYYTCKTALFGFVDDIEVLFIDETKTLHFRSASRVGRSDLGANAKRVNKLKSFLEN